jgi:hypothetical protein
MAQRHLMRRFPPSKQLSPAKLISFMQGFLSGDRFLLNLSAIASAIEWQSY